MFITVDFDFVTLRSSPFLFLQSLLQRFGATNQSGILSTASGAEMAAVVQLRKIVPFVTCEIVGRIPKCLRVHVW